jgi:hypothetical protein
MENTEVLTAVITTLIGIIFRAVEKHKLKKSGLLKDKPDTTTHEEFKK